MSWRDWMASALYDPGHGYYTCRIRTVGRRGDFATSATLGDALGRAVAAWVKEEWQRAGEKLSLIEMGPGDGSLHDGVLKALGWMGRRGVSSHLVEVSPVLRGVQQEKLRGRSRRTTWHGNMAAALAACGGRAVIFSNELADAFPATLLQWQDGVWQEVWLNIAANGAIVEELRECPAGLDSSATGLNCSEGQRIEVLHSWREWLQGWRPGWTAGAMLTVDYGGTPEEIYHRRPGGTARGYLHHQPLEAGELYAVTGRCDITVDVNFTDLRRWGEAAGLTTAEYLTQREFVSARTAVADAVHGEGNAGDAFRCLIQRPAA